MLLRNEGRRFGSRGIQEIKKDSKLQYGLQHSTLRGAEAAHCVGKEVLMLTRFVLTLTPQS